MVVLTHTNKRIEKEIIHKTNLKKQNINRLFAFQNVLLHQLFSIDIKVTSSSSF